ncbi:hypothetical protein CA600_05270 [Paenibacillus sp. VTT E-133280]|uniref:hypothetical protein n=1 Tax=unclassified Paenibacillus TaxID=185978 RepID=UPI00061FCCC4|nr:MULTISPECIES: hypothetical protein [unclassified Paenibacillus]KKC47798.1 hypothetical protein VE23_12860 [Paenibacillus sp. D9]OZQ68834.1 hypothetical protein CA600_05270 [Paenibacillus sp. VTT E-133280]
MQNIQIGSFVLNGQLILYLSYGAGGWLMLQYRLRGSLERRIYLSDAANAFWLWLLVWKGSFLIFYPIDVITQPMSLLYFDGGERGRWIASLVTASYIWYRTSKQNLSVKMWIDMGIWFTLSGWLVYHLLLLITGEESSLYHTANAGMTVLLLISLLVSQKGSDSGSGLNHAVWFSIGNVLLSFLVADRPVWLLSFSKQQIIFLLAAACLTGWSWLDEKQQKGGPHG